MTLENLNANATTDYEFLQEAKIANEKRFLSIVRELRQDRELTREEARFLVSMYYSLQEERIRNYARSKKANDSPMLFLMGRTSELLEQECKRALDRFSDGHPVGQWLRAITGIGPVMAAGLLAHIDITKCNTAGKLWAFAGLAPGQRAERGKKLTYSPDLKKLCYLIGESFVKVSGRESDVYGKLYRQRKEYESAKNEKLDYADQAREKLEKFKIGRDTEAFKYYSQGMLPPARIHLRAARWAVKIFLSHLQQVWYEYETGEKPPLPFAIAILGHADLIKPKVDRI